MSITLTQIPSVEIATNLIANGSLSSRYLAIDTETPVRAAETFLDNAGVKYFVPEIIKPRKSAKSAHFVKIRLDMPVTVNGDTINPMLLFSNNHDGLGSFTVRLGVYRFVCSNGLVIGSDLFKASIRHVRGPKSMSFLAELEVTIQKFLDYVISGKFAAELEAATTKTVTKEKGIEIIKKLNLSEKMTDQCVLNWQNPMRKEDSSNNVWSLWNVVNETMRKRSRSNFADLKKNTNLMDAIMVAAA